MTTDVASWIVKFFDLGLTGALVGGMLFAFLRVVPAVLKARSEENQAERKMRQDLIQAGVGAVREFGNRIAAAQERQSDAVTRLTEHMARHDGMTIESMDSLQMAIASVDQRVMLLEKRLGDLAGAMTPLGTLDRKIDELLQTARKG